ncbi:MAG: radical SAM protein [Oligoflexia bacterium]|nr:radical SAM protein [Oligoflexia bacterium]
MPSCGNCPRKCRERYFCSKTADIKINVYQLHHGEEPPVSGSRGSGTVFFSNCNLRCGYCQNYRISQYGSGYDITAARLRDICRELAGMGAHNINFVTPTPYADKLADVISELKSTGFDLPVVWNCGGYESPQFLKRLRGLVDIYLPDFKYSDNDLAVKLSCAPGYPRIAAEAIHEMRSQNDDVFDDEGVMKSGLIIRHLVLPSYVENSKGVLDRISETLGTDTCISLMSQYTPVYKTVDDPLLGRTVSCLEYREVCDHFGYLGFDKGFLQGLESATKEMIPDFFP